MGLHEWETGPSREIPAMHKGNHAQVPPGSCSELGTFPQTSHPFSAGFSEDSPEKGPDLEKIRCLDVPGYQGTQVTAPCREKDGEHLTM